MIGEVMRWTCVVGLAVAVLALCVSLLCAMALGVPRILAEARLRWAELTRERRA